MLVGYTFKGVYDHGLGDEVSAFAVPAVFSTLFVRKHGTAGRAYQLCLITRPEF